MNKIQDLRNGRNEYDQDSDETFRVCGSVLNIQKCRMKEKKFEDGKMLEVI